MNADQTQFGINNSLDHVQRTIDEATMRIGQLQDLVKGLHLLRDWSGNGVESRESRVESRMVTRVTRAEVTSVKPKKRGRPAKVSVEAEKQRNVNGKGKSHPETLRICAKVAELAEPFGGPGIAEAAGIEWKKASNFITQGKLKGWLKSAGHGLVTRTAKFPVGVESRGSKVESQDLDEQLAVTKRRKEQVLADLDLAQKDLTTAERNGRETMAKILRDKVLKLQHEYEELS